MRLGLGAPFALLQKACRCIAAPVDLATLRYYLAAVLVLVDVEQTTSHRMRTDEGTMPSTSFSVHYCKIQ